MPERLSHRARYVVSSATSALLFAEQTEHDRVRYRLVPCSQPEQLENIAFELDLRIKVFDGAFVILFELLGIVGRFLLFIFTRPVLATLGIVTPRRARYPVIPGR